MNALRPSLFVSLAIAVVGCSPAPDADPDSGTENLVDTGSMRDVGSTSDTSASPDSPPADVDTNRPFLVPSCSAGLRTIPLVRSDSAPRRGKVVPVPRSALRSLDASLETPPLLLDDRSREVVGSEELHSVTAVTPSIEYDGLTGSGVRVAVIDSGVDADHPDFLDDSGQSRVSGDGPAENGLLPGDHGTKVAAVLAGSGGGSGGAEVDGHVFGPYQLRGHAPRVEEIVSVRIQMSDVSVYAQQFAHVFNHSHTYSNNTYTPLVAEYDGVIRDGFRQPPRVVVTGIGNNGDGPVLPFYTSQGYFSVLTPLKNSITVGAVNANDLTYSYRASMGPTLDGRIKPDVVAPGYVDYRPLEGVTVTFEEFALRSTDGTADLVWDRTGDGGWVAEGAYEGLAPGESVTLAGGLGHHFILAPVGGIDTSIHDRVTFRMNVALDPTDEAHRHPATFTVQYDRDGDGDFEHGFYADFDESDRRAGVVEHTLSLAEVASWMGSIAALRITPIHYRDRLYTAVPGGGYGRIQGTSYAAPIVSGGAALLLEQFATLHGVDLDNRPPLPSTVRAILIHTATDLAHPTPSRRDVSNPDTGEPVTYFEGPDFATGFGLVDFVSAAALVAHHSEEVPAFVEESMAEDSTHAYRIPVAAGAPLVATIAWDDAPGDYQLPFDVPQLVNDFDVVAVAPDGSVHSPWILDPPPLDEATIASGIDPVTETPRARRCVGDTPFDDDACVDRRNNVEKIVVDDPAEGEWTLLVRGKIVTDDAQNYSLVVSQPCE